MRRRRKINLCVLIILFAVLTVNTKVYAAKESTKFLTYLTEAAEQGNVYEVRQDGLGDFTSIQEGVDYAEAGDTLIIYPGIYEENVVIMDKEVNLIGISKEACVLTANADNYHYIPLTISAGLVYNMTICATSTKEAYKPVRIPEYVTESGDIDLIYKWQDKFLGYAVHVEQDYSIGRELIIDDCKIISDANQCLGIGFRPEFKIEITDCELIAKAGGGCIYSHNSPLSGESELIMKNCELKNYHAPYVMSLYSMGETNPVYMTFQNVKVSTVAYEEMDSYNITNANTWFDVDQLENIEFRTMLSENYGVPFNSDLIYHYTTKEYTEFTESLNEQESLLGELPELKEGITYMEMHKDENENDINKYINERLKRRFVINIENKDKNVIGDGWCGLSHIYLTEESYGNTLIEMNYPRSESE